MRSSPSAILAFRNGSLGNTLVAIPALRALRNRYPHAALHVVVDPTGLDLLRFCPWIDTLVPYDKHGRDRGISAHVRLVGHLRGLNPDVAVLFKRFFRNGLLAFLSGAPIRVGYSTDGHSPFLNRTIPYDGSIPIVDLNLRLASLLNADSLDRRLEVFLSDEDLRDADVVLSRLLPPSQAFAAVHYGGQTTPPAFFPIDLFASVLAESLPERFPVVLLGAGEVERSFAERLRKGQPQVLSATDLPIRTTAAIIRKARLFVGFNSGLSHLAAATCTPGIVLYPNSKDIHREIMKWQPAFEGLRALVVPDSPAAVSTALKARVNDILAA